MSTIEIHVTPKQEKFIRTFVKSGRAKSPAAVVHKALDVLAREEMPKKTRTKKLPKWLQASLKDVEEGRVYGPFNTVKELRASLESDNA